MTFYVFNFHLNINISSSPGLAQIRVHLGIAPRTMHKLAASRAFENLADSRLYVRRGESAKVSVILIS